VEAPPAEKGVGSLFHFLPQQAPVSQKAKKAPDPYGQFSHRVIAMVRRIPPGRVATYGDVAALAGRPRAARAVGNVMRDCHRVDVPCHRVIAAGGRLRGHAYTGEMAAADGTPGYTVRRLH